MAFYLRHLNDEGEHDFSKVWEGNRGSLVVSDRTSPFPGKKHEVIGYCKGLFLLEYEGGVIIVWNPSVDEFTVIPLPSDMISPPCPYRGCDGTCTSDVVYRVCGLGFDPHSEDYKIIRLVTHYYQHPKYLDHALKKQTQLYSIRNDCWKEIESTEEYGYDVMGWATYVDGICYWIAQHTSDAAIAREVIISFDLTKEKFSTIDLPCRFSLTAFGHMLMDFEGSLGLLLYQRMHVYKTFLPWIRVIKDGRYRWTKEMGFKVEVQAERPLGYFRSGEVLLLEGHYSKLLAYDSVSQELSKADEINDHPYRMQLFPYFQNALRLQYKCPAAAPYVENTVLLQRLDTATSGGTGLLVLIPPEDQENASAS